MADVDLRSPGTIARGTAVGRYLVLDTVGAGATGTVYVAYDPGLDRRVAIEVLRARFAGEEGRQRILREAQALAQLTHPNVITGSSTARSRS